MVAVLFTTSPVVGGPLLWVMLAVVAMGIGPLVGWRKPIPAPVKRIVVAALIAVALAVPLYAVRCAACDGCSEFWLTWFWVCV